MSYLNILPLPDGFDKNLSLINDDCLYNVANGIRRLLGTEDTYKPPQMPDAIRSIAFSNFAESILGGGGIIREYDEFETQFTERVIGVAVGPDVIALSGINRIYDTIGDMIPPVCGPNVISMYYAYKDCWQMIGPPVCGLKVETMENAYAGCSSLTGSPVCGPNVTEMRFTYFCCENLTGSPVCGPNVIDMTSAYSGCSNLTGSPVCGPNVTSMFDTYGSCENLTGSPVCGPNVIYMQSAYTSCYNLTGEPVCGENVENMYDAYGGCSKLTGAPVSGNNVINMTWAYWGCDNLTGQPKIGKKVEDISDAFGSCTNIHGSATIPYSVNNMQWSFSSCLNLSGALLYPDQTKLNNALMNGAFNCNGSDPYQRQVRLNVIFNNYQLYKNARANAGIWGCTLSADAQAELLVNLPQAYPNGVIYSNSQYQTVRGCYNAAQNLYVYCME